MSQFLAFWHILELHFTLFFLAFCCTNWFFWAFYTVLLQIRFVKIYSLFLVKYFWLKQCLCKFFVVVLLHVCLTPSQEHLTPSRDNFISSQNHQTPSQKHLTHSRLHLTSSFHLTPSREHLNQMTTIQTKVKGLKNVKLSLVPTTNIVAVKKFGNNLLALLEKPL